MDNRKPPDTNVVQLRRDGDPSDEERQRLASTIFAEQDEIGTFSRGNLVPPAPTTPAAPKPPSCRGGPVLRAAAGTVDEREDQRRSGRRRGRRDSRVLRTPRLSDPSRDEPEHRAAADRRSHARQRESPQRGDDLAPPQIALCACGRITARSNALDLAHPRRRVSPARRAWRAARGRRGARNDRRRRRARCPRRQAAREPTRKRTFIARHGDSDACSSGSCPFALQPPKSQAQAALAHRPSTPGSERARRPRGGSPSDTRAIEFLGGGRTRRSDPVADRAGQPGQPAAYEPGADRGDHKRLGIEHRLRPEQPAGIWSQRNTRTWSFT